MKEIVRRVIARVRAAYREVITWLNSGASLVALYALQNPVISDKVLFFVPDGALRQLAAVVLPIIWFWVVQKGKEIDKQRQAVP